MSPSPDIASNRNADENAFLSRSASFDRLPDIPITEPGSPGLRRTFSDITFHNQTDSPSKEDVAAGKDILRRTSLRSRDKEKPAVAVSRFTLSSEDLDDKPKVESQDAVVPLPETRPPEPVHRPSKPRSMSGRLVNLARKPWISSSPTRPPSPSAKSTRFHALRSDSPSQTRPQSPSKLSFRSESPTEADSMPPSRRRTILNKRPKRPMVAVVAQGRADSPTPSSPSTYSLRPKQSLEKLTASLNVSTPVLPPMPKNAAATAAAHSATSDPPRKRDGRKDDLWAAFRGLEADFQKFQSKSTALKVNVIRSSLLPFLNRNKLGSCKSLRPEDLDRRVNILNKWWTGLLEMLNGKHNQSISGTDRPVYFDAVVGIMTRPEWRSAFPTSQKEGSIPKPLQPTATSISESSETSSGSDFLIESIHHNLRNIFVQNLLSQMAFVVERMSSRHAPASLVAFCGKACAYAFFFCSGVADILIRLWNTPSTVYRRILAESGVDRSSNVRLFTQDLALNFPTALRPLAFHSHAPLVRYLRQKPDVPLNTSQIPWQGPWVSRWCGRDTDLFFVFAKYIHILYADSLPSEVEKTKRILAPGLLPIHSQLLVVLEDTLYKQSVPQMAETHTAAAVTFDDFIEGADTSVSALPLGAANSHRSMAENRLIILLRDFLSESSVEPNHARLLYAESFCTVMKTAAQRTSLFDHNACFLLCDFIDEVIPIITRYSQSNSLEIFDWKFWLDVCRQMMKSENSLTEVRVFSFLFCIWNTWVASEERKADLCLNFLLHEPTFYHYFTHWSPMVRAYFQRILCWRVGRFHSEPSQLDSTIYETLSDRLQRVWAYYLAFQTKAEEELTAPLSSAPCTPAPGRRIIIIRCDNPLSPTNLFVSFDRVLPPPPEQPTTQKPAKSSSSVKSDSSTESQPPPKKRWNFFKAVFGSSSSSKSSDPPSSSSSEETEDNKSDTTVSTDKCLDGHSRPSEASEIVRPKETHQPFSFKFSLEWMDRPQWPSKNKRLFTPCLPVAAQLHVQMRRAGKTSDTDTASESDNPDARNNSTPDGLATNENVRASLAAVTTSDTLTEPQNLNRALSDKLAASKYAGRALAEWAQIVSECDSFFARRRDEGVPCDRMVETPTLGVESFRK